MVENKQQHLFYLRGQCNACIKDMEMRNKAIQIIIVKALKASSVFGDKEACFP